MITARRKPRPAIDTRPWLAPCREATTTHFFSVRCIVAPSSSRLRILSYRSLFLMLPTTMVVLCSPMSQSLPSLPALSHSRATECCCCRGHRCAGMTMLPWIEGSFNARPPPAIAVGAAAAVTGNIYAWPSGLRFWASRVDPWDAISIKFNVYTKFQCIIKNIQFVLFIVWLNNKSPYIVSRGCI